VLAEARVRAAMGQSKEALKNVEAMVQEAEKAGLGILGLEACLLQSEIEIAVGRIPAAREHLDALLKTARAHGVVSIAKKAEAAMRKAPPG
jgi:hypothetical protein